MNSLIIKSIMLLLGLATGLGMNAQFYSPYLSNRIEWQDADTGKLQLAVHMNNYLKNNEYFGPIYHGYTLFGTQLRSAMAFSPKKFLRLEGGVFLQNDLGSDKFTVARPFFSVKLKKKSHEVIFGNLEGGARHRMIEPLFDPERSMTHPFENGLQHLVKTDHFISDAWIDWVKREDVVLKIQEEIHAGVSMELIPLKKEKYKFSIPIQGIVWHLGGQLNEALYPIESIANAAAGLRWEGNPGTKLIDKFSLESFAMLYAHSNHSELRRYSEGHAFYSGVNVESSSGLFVNAYYFFGYHYITGTGAPLFQSVSSHYYTYYENYRELINVRVGYRKELFPGMWIDVRVEPYFDIGGGFWEYSYGGYITYTHSFTLKKHL